MKVTVLGSNQATVKLNSGVILLFSYSTPVAAFVPGRGLLHTSVKYSAATTKHISGWSRAHFSLNTTVTVVPQAEIDSLVPNV